LGVCCIAVVAVVLASGYFINQAAEGFVENPEQAAEVAGSIVDYELPAGFQEQGAMDFLGMKAAFITSANDQSVIMLMEFPSALQMNQEQMEQQMEQALAQQGSQGSVSFSPVGTEEVNINNQTVVLTTSEGTGQNGGQVRQILGVFEGNSGNTAMLMIMGDVESWDEEGIDSFIDSLE
jgi:hypothetical protein